MNTPLTPAQIESLRQIDACTLANVIESYHARLRNVGFADGSVRAIFPRLPPMVGFAVTVKVRGASPPTGGGHHLEQTAWWDHILSVPSPRVVVVQDVGSKPGLGALLGEVHVNILRALQCVGAVTNGSVRDIPAVDQMSFPLFAGSVSVSHSYVHIVEVGCPVELGGLAVHPGDLLHGDLHGVQSIPLELVPEIPAAADELRRRDQALIALCRSPDFSVQRLRDAVHPPAHS